MRLPYPSECVVYLDFYKKRGDGVYDVYVDFRFERDFHLFLYTGRNLRFNENNTYLELCNLKTKKRLRSGCYYKLNLELLHRFEPSPDYESLFIGLSYNLEEMLVPQEDSEELLQKHGPMYPSLLDCRELRWLRFCYEYPSEFELPPLGNSSLSVCVRDVGQANWNELRVGNHICYVYDLGAELYANRTQVASIFDARKDELERDKPVLVLSHWDLDHYHCLRYTDQQTMQNCFSKFICVDAMKSVTSRRVFVDMCESLGYGNVFCVQPMPRTDGVSMHMWKTQGDISIYVGEKNRNINYSGLSMFVRGQQMSVNFTGDVRLLQAKNVYDQEIVKGHLPPGHILIAPHHGGNVFQVYRWYSYMTSEVDISVGYPNIYGHPHPQMLSYLHSLCGNNVFKTCCYGDIIRMI